MRIFLPVLSLIAPMTETENTSCFMRLDLRKIEMSFEKKQQRCCAVFSTQYLIWLTYLILTLLWPIILYPMIDELLITKKHGTKMLRDKFN